jgi:putative SOS response-associated peptidase YedK
MPPPSPAKTGFAVSCGDSSGIRQQYPQWAKDPSIGLRTINAKAETITTAPAFREAIKYRRCLVPADAFYEWQKLDAKNNQPFAIAMKDGQPYSLADQAQKIAAPSANPTLTIDRNLIASVVNLPEQRSVFLRKWYREFHRKWVCTNTTR